MLKCRDLCAQDHSFRENKELKGKLKQALELCNQVLIVCCITSYSIYVLHVALIHTFTLNCWRPVNTLVPARVVFILHSHVRDVDCLAMRVFMSSFSCTNPVTGGKSASLVMMPKTLLLMPKMAVLL